MLKVKAAEYYYRVGEHPDSDKLKQTLWNVMDMGTKQNMMITGHDSKGYKQISDPLDQLHKTQYGAIDFAKYGGGGDPIDLSKVGFSDESSSAARTTFRAEWRRCLCSKRWKRDPEVEPQRQKCVQVQLL